VTNFALTYPVNGTSTTAPAGVGRSQATISDALGSIPISALGPAGKRPSSSDGTASTFTATCPNYVAVADPDKHLVAQSRGLLFDQRRPYNAVPRLQQHREHFVSSSLSFTYNTAAPASDGQHHLPVDGTTYGTDWTGTITGSSLANETGRPSRTCRSIQQVGGSCWTGSGND